MATHTSEVSPQYLKLVKAFRLRPLQTRADLDAALRVLDTLTLRDDLTDQEQEYLEVLTDLVGGYEDAHTSFTRASGLELLRCLFEASGRNQAEVAKTVGVSESTISEILSGKRKMSVKHIEAFAKAFSVNPGALLESAKS